LTDWRRQRAAGSYDALSPAKRGPKPADLYATLLHKGTYHGSVSTMDRLLAEHGEMRERRDQLRHPVYQKPELIAERPNAVWSWDITKVMGPAKWTYFYLYVIIDIFARRIVGWCVDDTESATLFKPLIQKAILDNGVPPGQLTVHADRGGPMKAKATALLLGDPGVTKSHSRPHNFNDNPFFGRPLQSAQIPAPISTALRLHRRCQKLLPKLLRLVQPIPSSCRPRLDDPRSGPLWPGRGRLRRATGHARPRLHRKTRTLRAKATQAARQANRRLDQPTASKASGPSLNKDFRRLKVVDTFRQGKKVLTPLLRHRRSRL
jgi:transposase InsO family protein